MSREDIPKDYNHSNEANWQKIWDDKKIYKYIGDGSRPRYIIDTPPPYPTGNIHLGHVLNWAYIDFNARYRREKGFDVLFPQGWDCHGLPTEVKVEEIHNIKKNDVSLQEFREMCVDLTTENISLMKNQMKSLGYSQDWSREYITMTPEYRQRTQYSFLKMYDKDLIYQGIHPVNWCPRCETAIAFAEVEYKDNVTKLNYVNFPPAIVENKPEDNSYIPSDGNTANPEDKGILIATTRPELMMACVGVVIHPDDERYNNLLGKYVEVPLSGQKVKIIADTEVDPEYGTGAVMICTFGDKTDVSWVNKYNLDIIEAINEQGLITSAGGKYEGLTLDECSTQTINDLKEKGYLLKQEDVDQNVGVCWRCKTPIEILVKKQWFIGVRKLIEDVKKASNEMNWIPPHMESRLLNWADSMEWDWCISRQRLFATPIPVWYCDDCGKVHLPKEEDLPIDPTVDTPKESCECGCKSFTGETDVLDTWMDSSISPLSIAGWPDPSYKNHFPATIRPQGHDIIRTWAFYTMLRSIALTGEKPFSDIVINGMVFGEDGYKMSKSRGNVIAPDEVVKEYGADSLRTWAANSVPGSDVAFDWKDIKYGYKFLRKFWNAFRFVSMHIFDEDIKDIDTSKLNPMDKWILAKLDKTNEICDESFDKFKYDTAINTIEAFIWHDFCDEYIESAKYRLYNDVGDESRLSCKYTLKKVIIDSLKILAPITPYFAEEVYQYFSEDSIHQEFWPELNKIEEKYVNIGDSAINLIGGIRRFKSSNKIALNQPLNIVNIYTNKKDLQDIFTEFSEDIKGTLKINEFSINSGKPEVHEKVIEIEPDMGKVGPKFKNDAGKVIAYINSNDLDEIIKSLEDESEIIIEGKPLILEDLRVKKEVQGASGQKVDVFNLDELDVILEVIR